MKTIIRLLILCAVPCLTACSDNDDDYTPGEATADGCQTVYFDASNATANVFVPDDNVTSFDITLSRKVTDEAAEVPLKVSAAEGLHVPATVSFAAGAANATLTVSFDNLERAVVYPFEITIDDPRFVNHYAVVDGSASFKGYVLISTWETFAGSVTLNMTQKGVTYNMETRMERLQGMNLYRIPDFLGSGLYFTFSTDKAYPDWAGYYLIEPYSNYWNDDEDASWMDAYWFYDTANDSWPEWESFGGNTITGLSIMREYYGSGYFSYISFDEGYGCIGTYATYYSDETADYYNYINLYWTVE